MEEEANFARIQYRLRYNGIHTQEEKYTTLRIRAQLLVHELGAICHRQSWFPRFLKSGITFVLCKPEAHSQPAAKRTQRINWKYSDVGQWQRDVNAAAGTNA